MIVVSDTTAISNLLQVGCAELLPDLFERVLAPPAVLQELKAWHRHPPVWLEIVPVRDNTQTEKFSHLVHRGEAEAIALALEVRPDWILLDDSDGRQVAREAGLPILGLMGVLLLSKKKGLLQEVGPLMDRLQNDAGFFLSRKVRAEVLRLAGEEQRADVV